MLAENVSGKLGGLDLGIIIIARIGSTWANGGFPDAISKTVIPNDHISAYQHLISDPCEHRLLQSLTL